MIVTIKLRYGPNKDRRVSKQDIQENIDALTRSIEGKQQARDFVSLYDTRSILKGIQKQLPER